MQIAGITGQEAIRGNVDCLDMVLEAIEMLNDQQYARQPGGEASVGQHVRHVIDFYRCFLSGLKSGYVDYDARERETRLEDDRSFAKRIVQETRNRVAQLTVTRMKLSVSSQAPVAALPSTEPSTLIRELMFLQSHTTHHLAIVAILMRQMGESPDPAMGVSPSTLDYLSRRAT